MLEQTFIHSRGVRLRVQLAGRDCAPLVLLIHGLGGDSLEWRGVMDACEQMQANLRLAAVDLRGYGDSDKTPHGYDLTTAASDMAGVIRGLGYKDALVVGHGYGGMVAWTLAAHEPDRVRGIVTLGSAHPLVQFTQLLRHPLRNWSRTSRTLYAQLPLLPERKLVADDGLLAERLFRFGVAPGFRDTPAFAAAAAHRRQAVAHKLVARAQQEYQRWPFRSRLRPEGGRFASSFPEQITVPVLVLEGNYDPEFSAATSRASAAKSIAGRVHVLYGVGHYPHIEDPSLTFELLQNFATA